MNLIFNVTFFSGDSPGNPEIPTFNISNDSVIKNVKNTYTVFALKVSQEGCLQVPWEN